MIKNFFKKYISNLIILFALVSCSEDNIDDIEEVYNSTCDLSYLLGQLQLTAIIHMIIMNTHGSQTPKYVSMFMTYHYLVEERKKFRLPWTG